MASEEAPELPKTCFRKIVKFSGKFERVGTKAKKYRVLRYKCKSEYRDHNSM